jgi:hypothetical protein
LFSKLTNPPPPPHVYNTVQYYCHNYILIKEKYI